MQKNNLVLYKNQPAIITDIQGDKFEIRLEATTKKVREKDIVLLHTGTVASLSSVLNESLPQGNVDDALEFFEGETPSFFEISELIWGSYKPEQAWLIWETLRTSPLFICTTPDKPIVLRDKNETQALLEKQAAKNSAEAVRNEFLDALRTLLKKNNTSFDQFPIEKYSPFLQEIEALALGKTTQSKNLRDIKQAETPESAHEVLLKTKFWGIEKNPYPSRFGHSLYSSKVDIPKPVIIDEYTDLTHLTAFAIDNEGSTDPDDAVCFDGEYLWIHIANPADTIQPDSKSDLDARSRGSTLYVPEGAARMLGESAVDYFALGIHSSSQALSFKLKLTEKAEIESILICRTKIHVERLTYREADKRKESPELQALFVIAEKNRERRKKNGSISINMPEVMIHLDTIEGEKKVSIHPYPSTEAAKMIQEMMLLAGESAARFAFKNGIPFQFISQDTPSIPKQLPEGLAGEYKKRRAMHPRKVTTIPAMHAALGIAMYGQVTSPLRRYGDLVSHQQLLRFIDKKPLLETEDMLLRIAAGDVAARNANLAERYSRQHWTLVFLLQNPQWRGEAIILDIINNKAHISIPSIAQEADIPIKKETALNEVILVKAENINLAQLQVRFVPL